MTRQELKQALRDKITQRMRELKMTHRDLAYIMEIHPAALSRLLSVQGHLTVFSLHKIEQALQMKLINI